MVRERTRTQVHTSSISCACFPERVSVFKLPSYLFRAKREDDSNCPRASDRDGVRHLTHHCRRVGRVEILDIGLGVHDDVCVIHAGCSIHMGSCAMAGVRMYWHVRSKMHASLRLGARLVQLTNVFSATTCARTIMDANAIPQLWLRAAYVVHTHAQACT